MASTKKSYDPTEIVGEILGVPASLRPVVAEEKSAQICPFIKKKCAKDGRPICSFWERSGDSKAGYARRLVATCPKRFYQSDFLGDVIQECWPDVDSTNVQVLSEVDLPEFGRIDFVAVAFDADGNVENFLPIEVQAIDITSPKPLNAAYQALYKHNHSDKAPTTGGNWDNVYKRYVTQLVRKGFVAHSWGTKIVAVIQDEFFDYMFEKYPFMKGNAGDAETNILFFTYKFSPDAPISSGEHTLSLDEVHGTNHASLQSAHLYKKSPTKPEFAAALVERLTQRQKNRAKFVDKHGKGAVTTFSKFEVFTSKGD